MKTNSIKVIFFALASVSIGALFAMESTPTSATTSASENCNRLRQLAAIAQRDDATRQQIEQAKDLLSKAALLLVECKNDINAALLRSLHYMNLAELSPILSACSTDTPYIVELSGQILRNSGEFVIRAIHNNDVTLMQLLNNAQLLPARIHGSSPLSLAISDNKPAIARILLNDSRIDINEEEGGRTVLDVLVWFGTDVMIQEILPLILQDARLQKNVIVNSLRHAIHGKKIEVVRLLLQDPRVNINAKIDNNVRNFNDNSYHNMSASLLYEALIDRQLEKDIGILELLLNHPALDINAVILDDPHHNKFVPLESYNPFFGGPTKLVYQGHVRRTALLQAIEDNNINVVQLLLKHPKINVGLLVNYSENKRGTALDYAKESQSAGEDRSEIIKLLEDYNRQKERRNALLVRQRGVER